MKVKNVNAESSEQRNNLVGKPLNGLIDIRET